MQYAVTDVDLVFWPGDKEYKCAIKTTLRGKYHLHFPKTRVSDVVCNGLGGWKAQLEAECTIKNYTRRTLRSVYDYLNVGSKDKCCVSLTRQVWSVQCGHWELERGDWCWYRDRILYLVTELRLRVDSGQRRRHLPGPISQHTPTTCTSTTWLY